MKYLIEMNETVRRFLLGALFFICAYFFFTTGTWISVFALILSMVLFVYVNGGYIKIYHKKVTESFPSALQRNNFKADDSYLSFDFVKGIAINYEEEQIALLSRINRDSEFDFTTIPFSSIIESELREDNETLFKTSKGSAIGGALVGGVLAGGVGAIVGGLSGNKTGSETVQQLSLLLVVDDIVSPVYEINFVHAYNPPLPKSSQMYQDARSKATKWHKTISVILSKNKSNSSV